jgi:hypothetical protein
MEILKNILIRRYTHEDHPKVLELVRAVYNEGVYKKAVQRFQWQYEQNPNNLPEDPVIFVSEDDNNIVGMVGTFAQKVKIGNSIYPAYWVGDFMVHPDYRRGYHGINLAKELSAQPYLMMGFPADNTLNLWNRLKWVQFSQLVEYSRTFRFFDRLIGPLGIKNPKKIQIIDVEYFDERFDRLWLKASKDYTNIQVRDSRFLNWRFFKCPHISYRVLGAVSTNEVLGYIVVRDKKYEGYHEGIIVDMFTDRSNSAVMTALLEAGVSTLKTIGCQAIKMMVSSDDKMLNDTLRKNFSLVSEKKEQGLFINNTGNGLDSIIKGPHNWFLTKTDSDMDFS